MRERALPSALFALLAFVAVAFAARGGAAADTRPTAAARDAVVAQIDRYQRRTWRWQRMMGLRRTPSSFTARRSPDAAYRRWVLALWKQRAHRVELRALSWLAERVRAYQAVVHHWERVMGVRSGPLREAQGTARTLRERRALMSSWRRRARAVQRRAASPPFESAWRCIQRYEGAWTDSGAPYYGGLQMDLGFQRRYGSYLLQTKGTADRWTPAEQMWVAARAVRSGRGFYPWPNTARACGLL